MARRIAIAIAIGITRCVDAALALNRTRRISSVAYAFDDRASEEKTGRAIVFGRSVCSRRWLAFARPTRMRFATARELGRSVSVAIGSSVGARPDGPRHRRVNVP